ncbi:MAG: excisionase family DNA-binding protein [Cyanobacteria bacterium]|jgi:excisionase family DNA binding protein|nr:excisionase family DNA-binding protein [Cyanobacteria bacterium GSL.Bin1]
MPELQTTLHNKAQEEVLREFASELKSGKPISIGDKEFSLQKDFCVSLARLLEYMADHQEVVVFSKGKELTAKQAADLLGVSRPHLVKLLQTGEIPYAKTGSHYRILTSDLAAFRERRERRRTELSKLTNLLEEEGLYDE